MIKRYAAELIGTFGIVFAPVAVAGSSKIAGVDHDLLVAALASGLSVLAMIFTFGAISAAHFNPAVTFGFALAKRFPWKFVIPYWLAQLAGATLAAGLAAMIFMPGPGAHVPLDASAHLRNLGTEAAITFLLMLVIMAVATDKRVPGAVPAIAIGFGVVVGVLIGGPITGGSMNPARSLGPALVTGGDALFPSGSTSSGRCSVPVWRLLPMKRSESTATKRPPHPPSSR
ncbi:MAG: aquaporin [Nitrospiraceae bacterium]